MGIKLDSTSEYYYGEGLHEVCVFKYKSTGFLQEYSRTENGVNQSKVYYVDSASFLKKTVITPNKQFEYLYNDSNFLIHRRTLDTNGATLDVYSINYKVDNNGNWTLMEKFKNLSLIHI